MAHRRRKSTVKTTTASVPRIARRSASRGVRRYGSSTRGSLGRNRSASGRLGKKPNLRHRGARPRLSHHAPHERVDRNGESQVEDHRRHERDQQHLASGGRLPEHEVEDQRAELVEHRDHRDRKQRRVCTLATGRLAVAPDPVARERQQQRREPEHPEVAGVREQAGAEAGDGAEHRAAQQRDAYDRDQQELWTAVEEVDLREDRDLQDHGNEQESRRLGGVGGDHGATGTRLFETSAVTESSEPKLTYGSIWIVLKYAVSVWPTLATLPIWMPIGKSDGYCFDCVPAVMMTSPARTF